MMVVPMLDMACLRQMTTCAQPATIRSPLQIVETRRSANREAATPIIMASLNNGTGHWRQIGDCPGHQQPDGQTGYGNASSSRNLFNTSQHSLDLDELTAMNPRDLRGVVRSKLDTTYGTGPNPTAGNMANLLYAAYTGQTMAPSVWPMRQVRNWVRKSAQELAIDLLDGEAINQP